MSARADRPSFSRDARGAIYVEFLVAFLPLFVLFLGLVQMADLHQANVVVNHAAMVTSRAAVVILPDDPKFYDNVPVGQFGGKRKDEIYKAASFTLRASRSLTEVKVTMPTQPNGSDAKTQFGRDDLVRVKVQATYVCRVPFVNRMVCDAKTSTRTVTAEAALPNQGAGYDY